MPESIEDSGGGLVYHSDDELANGMSRLMDEAGLRHDLGTRGHTAYRTQWTTDAYLERYLGLIDRIAQAKRAGGTVVGRASR
jgi:glycosyltransferase involved in cell wall biosynthesis